MRALVVLALIAAVVAVQPRAQGAFRFARLPGDEKCAAAGGTCVALDKGEQCATTLSAPKQTTSGKCAGNSQRKCCEPVAVASTGPSIGNAPSSGGSKSVCLTFDDGPFAVTKDLVDMLQRQQAKAVFFVNCHDKEGGGAEATAVNMAKLIASSGNTLANHMCYHDIMAMGQYFNNYYPAGSYDQWKAKKIKPQNAVDCLQTPAQKQKFDDYFTATIRRYEKVLPVAEQRGPHFMKFLRLNGDGRYFTCLKQAAAAIRNDVVHIGWNYEITNANTFAERAEFIQTGVAGVRGTGARPKDKDVILAHDAHWSGKVANLESWIAKLKSEGFNFVLPDASGGCAGALRRDT